MWKLTTQSCFIASMLSSKFSVTAQLGRIQLWSLLTRRIYARWITGVMSLESGSLGCACRRLNIGISFMCGLRTLASHRSIISGRVPLC